MNMAPRMGSHQVPLVRACELLEVARSGFYRYQRLLDPTTPEGARRAWQAEELCNLTDRVDEICLHHSKYGYRRVTVQLRRQGWLVNHKRVLWVMRKEGLLCRVRRAFARTTDSKHGFKRYPNLLPDLSITGINQVWVADLTYIRLREQFVFLAVILDSFSRKVIGWDLSTRLEHEGCLRALEMALAKRQPAPGFIHHSDQGVQYACTEYTGRLDQVGARISMSRKGNPYDNARAESFMKTLKSEEVYLLEYRDFAHAQARIGHFIEEVYNHERLHSALGYLPPEEFEAGLQTSLQTPLTRGVELVGQPA